MRLTQRLLRYLHRVFNKDPVPFLALRLTYDGGMTWAVQDAVLKTHVTGGSGVDLTVDLSQYTLQQLVAFLLAQPGYNVAFSDGGDNSQLSARVLLDATGDIGLSNGDHIYGYSNVLWALLESMAGELQVALDQITQAVLQMSTTTASDIWLDELGGYYAVPRLPGEVDAQYGPRIIAEVLRARGNNVAMELAIEVFTGQNTTVTDVVDYTLVAPLYDGSITHDGAHTYNSGSVARYGLFDVEYGYDLENGGDFSSFKAVVAGVIDRLRDGGYHLRALNLVGGAIKDLATPPTEGPLTIAAHAEISETADAATEATAFVVHAPSMIDAPYAATEDLELSITTNYAYDGSRSYDGSFTHRGGLTSTESL